jgi:uncharacterized protein YjbJ (UPF0337 family)
MGSTDEAKGRAKQAIGTLTGNKSLEREGKVDRVADKVKNKVDDAKDWVADKVDKD